MSSNEARNIPAAGFADAVASAGAWTVGVDARRRYGASGIVWADGVVVTADHVVERDEDITVVLPDGSEVAATLAGRDPGNDLAVLRVEGLPAPATRAEASRVGDICLAVGRAGGNLSASLGIVSAVGTLWRRRRGGRRQVIRPDVTLYPGFSGGPLISAAGELLGMSTSGRGGVLAVPVTEIEPIVGELLAHGRRRRAYLGMTSQPVALPDAAAAGQETGLLVVGVESDSPAASGGLMVGDIVVGIGEAAIRDTDDLREALSPDVAGQATQVRILRGGAPQTLDVTVGER